VDEWIWVGLWVTSGLATAALAYRERRLSTSWILVVLVCGPFAGLLYGARLYAEYVVGRRDDCWRADHPSSSRSQPVQER
jgi:hypothetical protein